MAIPEARDDQNPIGEAGAHPRGIRRAMWMFCALAAAALLPYLLPSALFTELGFGDGARDRFLPWKIGDAIPFSRFLDFRPPTRPAIAGVQERTGPSTEDEEALLRAAPLPEAEPVAPVAEGGAVDPALRIDPAEYEGMTRPIVDPTHVMDPFYERLYAVARGEPELARIAMYSDSINGSDRVSQVLRHALQERFGDGGKGFVPVAPGWQYQRHHDVVWDDGDNFLTAVLNRGNEESGYYGLGGVIARNRGIGSTATWATTDDDDEEGSRVSRFALFHQAFPGGGTLTLSVDGRSPRTVSTDAPAVEDRVFELEVPDGPHELELGVADGDLRLYGVVMERQGPGVVVDGLMLIGAFTRVLLHYDEEHFVRQHAQRQSDLVIFWFGGNDAVSETTGFSRADYVEKYKEALSRLRRGRPDTACLVMSVNDAAETIDGVVRSRRRIPLVVAAQETAAREAGCAFFNTFEATGGPGTAWRWYRNNPRLVSVDFRHLTPEGARVVGSLFYKALLRGYDEYLARRTD